MQMGMEGAEVKQDQIDEFFAQVDTDKNGVIDKDEMLVLITQMYSDEWSC